MFVVDGEIAIISHFLKKICHWIWRFSKLWVLLDSMSHGMFATGKEIGTI